MLSYALSKHHHTPHADWSPLVSHTNRPPDRRGRQRGAPSPPSPPQARPGRLPRAAPADGDAALDLICGYEPQLCLLDATLPVRSGWEVLREVQQVGSRDLKVI